MIYYSIERDIDESVYRLFKTVTRWNDRVGQPLSFWTGVDSLPLRDFPLNWRTEQVFWTVFTHYRYRIESETQHAGSCGPI